MTTTTDGIEYVPIASVAKALGTTEMRVLMLLKRRALEGDLIDGAWYVTAASLAGFDPKAQAPEPELPCKSSCSSSTCGCH